MNRNSSRAAGTQTAGADLRQSGSSSSSGSGSSTAPDKECAPRLAAFSSTQTLNAGLSCFSRIAQASPAGPAPTFATSYSMTSRGDSLIEEPPKVEIGPQIEPGVRGPRKTGDSRSQTRVSGETSTRRTAREGIWAAASLY